MQSLALEGSSSLRPDTCRGCNGGSPGRAAGLRGGKGSQPGLGQIRILRFLDSNFPGNPPWKREFHPV